MATKTSYFADKKYKTIYMFTLYLYYFNKFIVNNTIE